MKFQKALITGASAGIGEATARLLAAKGMDLVLVARRMDRLEGLQRELTNTFGVKIEIFPLDVSKRKDIEKFIDKESRTLFGVDVLINNAGLARGLNTVQESDLDHWDQMLDTNVKGLLYMTRALLPFMIKNDLGHIVNIGSVAGIWTYPKAAVYCATKAAVRSFSEGLRLDLMGTNIRVTNIEPGMVETEFSMVRFGDHERAKQVYSGLQPLTGEDIAETIWWSLERPSHVNIQELVVFPTAQAGIQHVNRKS